MPVSTTLLLLSDGVYWQKCDQVAFSSLAYVRPHHRCWCFIKIFENVWIVVMKRERRIITVTTSTPLRSSLLRFSDLQHNNTPVAHFLLRWRATSDFLKPSKLKRRLARRLAAATSARWLPLVRVSLLLRPSLSLRSWSSSESVARRAFALLKERVGEGVGSGAEVEERAETISD